jgi:hypothetical protein
LRLLAVIVWLWGIDLWRFILDVWLMSKLVFFSRAVLWCRWREDIRGLDIYSATCIDSDLWTIYGFYDGVLLVQPQHSSICCKYCSELLKISRAESKTFINMQARERLVYITSRLRLYTNLKNLIAAWDNLHTLKIKLVASILQLISTSIQMIHCILLHILPKVAIELHFVALPLNFGSPVI